MSKFWTSFFSFGKADAITLFPFIFVRKAKFKENRILINHEMIHIRQAVEMLVIFFYCCYLFEFLIRFCQYRNFHLAYLNISFEREAYARQNDAQYLVSRKFWAFTSYLRH